MIIFLIIALIIAIFIIWGLATYNRNVDEQVNKRAEFEKKRIQQEYKQLIDNQKKLLEHTQKECQRAKKLQNYYEAQIKGIDTVVALKCAAYPQLAPMVADLQTVYYERAAEYLRIKPHPAYTEAHRIGELRKKTNEILSEKIRLEYELAYIRYVIPNIDDIFDDGFTNEDAISFQTETEENTDRVRFYLESDEYQKLGSIERNQLALDRYIAGRKSKWQIGRDYEMYIGYLYEKKGCTVEYMGIIKGLEDLGRDLIVKNNGKTSIIQCKNWSKEKTIHEKHIFQLFGTVVLYNIEHPQANAKGIFISTTKLSETALQVAKELDIQVVQKDHGEFPRIKCNINRSTGEKIYHLPFDQQYDSARIDKTQGEFYALTVAEAETNGFRRAFRHFG